MLWFWLPAIYLAVASTLFGIVVKVKEPGDSEFEKVCIVFWPLAVAILPFIILGYAIGHFFTGNKNGK